MTTISTLAEQGKRRYPTCMSLYASPDRRHFLKSAAAGLAVSPFAAIPAFAKEESRFEFCTFTKPLQSLSYDDTAKAIAELGFNGIEAPVRPKGHVLPERVEEDLPKMVEALKKQNLNLTILTSGINEVSEEQHTEKVLRTAAKLGVKRFRMNYYRYDLKKPLDPQLEEFGAKLKDLIALTDELGIKPVYQNHSGDKYFGAPIWDMAELFSAYTPDQIGVAFDIGHATVEGAKAWPLNYARIRPYIDTIYIKEPAWDDNQLSWGPLGEGVVDQSFFKLIKESDFSGPISLHIEYLGHGDPKIIPAVLKATRENFATLKKLLS